MCLRELLFSFSPLRLVDFRTLLGFLITLSQCFIRQFSSKYKIGVSDSFNLFFEHSLITFGSNTYPKFSNKRLEK